MRNKWFIFSMVAVIGVVGCSKEEETAAVSSGVEQSQLSTTAPVAAGTQATPDKGSQTNVQPQEQLPASTAMPQSQAPDVQTSPVVTITNEAQKSPVQPTPAQSASDLQNASSTLPVEQGSVPAASTPVEVSGGNLTPPSAASAPISQTQEPVVVEQPKQ